MFFFVIRQSEGPKDDISIFAGNYPSVRLNACSKCMHRQHVTMSTSSKKSFSIHRRKGRNEDERRHFLTSGGSLVITQRSWHEGMMKHALVLLAEGKDRFDRAVSCSVLLTRMESGRFGRQALWQILQFALPRTRSWSEPSSVAA